MSEEDDKPIYPLLGYEIEVDYILNEMTEHERKRREELKGRIHLSFSTSELSLRDQWYNPDDICPIFMSWEEPEYTSNRFREAIEYLDRFFRRKVILFILGSILKLTYILFMELIVK